MEAFNSAATCPKCGHDTVGTQYQAPHHAACDDTCRDKKPERLERRCERCRYWWDERCADVPAPSEDDSEEVEGGP